MTNFTMIKNNKSGLYYILENGIKVKNDIFKDKQDFIKELIELGIDKYNITVKR